MPRRVQHKPSPSPNPAADYLRGGDFRRSRSVHSANLHVRPCTAWLSGAYMNVHSFHPLLLSIGRLVAYSCLPPTTLSYFSTRGGAAQSPKLRSFPQKMHAVVSPKTGAVIARLIECPAEQLGAILTRVRVHGAVRAFSPCHLPVHTLLRCPHSPQIPNTSSLDIVWTHENTA